jgi:hypothetical protein
MPHKQWTGVCLFSFIVILTGVSGCLASDEKKPGVLTVRPGVEFTLRQNQIARMEGNDLEIEIVEFYNSPCPPELQCFWSGLGVGLEYRSGGEVRKGVDLTQAFGYQTTILDTDYESYADLVMEKIQ